MSGSSALRRCRAACCGGVLLLLGAAPAGAVATTICQTCALAQLLGEDVVPDDAEGPGACTSSHANAIAFMTSTAGAEFGALVPATPGQAALAAAGAVARALAARLRDAAEGGRSA